MYNFLNLNLHDRALLLWKEGIFLVNARGYEMAYSLYSLNGFYVEVVIANSETGITHIIPFKSGWRLDKYLDELQIPSLLIAQ